MSLFLVLDSMINSFQHILTVFFHNIVDCEIFFMEFNLSFPPFQILLVMVTENGVLLGRCHFELFLGTQY